MPLIIAMLRTIAIVTLFAGALAAQPSPRPNILWITCEDISPDLGCYGSPDAFTPHLDRLASQGVRYANAFAPIGVCAPARSCIITGMYPPSIGTQHMRCRGQLPAGVLCFPEYLRKAGYWCTNRSKTDYNFRHAKTTWDRNGRKAHWRGRADGQPFFSVVNFTTTHESQVRLPDERFAKRTQRLSADERHDPETVRIPPYHPDTPVVRRDWARYHDLITAMDKQVGDLLRQLEQDGLADDTIVFFYSDHGAGLPRSKRWLYDSSTRVPFLVRFPEKYAHLAPGQPGSTSKRLISFVDLAPTVLSLVGIDIPRHMQGTAFLGNQNAEPRRFVHGFRDRMDERYDMMRSVFDGRYRYIRNFMPHVPWSQHISYCCQMPTWQEWERLAKAGRLTGATKHFWAKTKPREELYDTWADPWEVRNLATDPDQRARLATLRGEVERWMGEIRDLGLLPEAEMRLRFGGGSEYDAVRSAPERYPFAKILAAAKLVGSDARLVDFMDLLADDDAAVRWWGLTALHARGMQMESKDVFLLKDSSPSVRLAAAACAPPAVAVPLLQKALEHESDWVKLRALNQLDALGEQAAPAMARIRELRKHRNRQIQKVARKIAGR